MTFADCRKMKPPVDELPLCIDTPPNKRGRSQFYIWGRISPFHRLGEYKFTPDIEARAGDFAQRAIIAQPGDYAETVASDLLRTFRWKHPPFPEPTTYDYYLFQQHPPQPPPEAARRMRPYDRGHLGTHVVRPYARIMQAYQRYFFLRGTVFGLILLVGLGALLRRRWDALVPPTTAEFDYRYVIPAIPVACVAAALAFTRRDAAGPRAEADPRPVVTQAGPRPEAV
jgi:hypothetical protein